MSAAIKSEQLKGLEKIIKKWFTMSSTIFNGVLRVKISILSVLSTLRAISADNKLVIFFCVFVVVLSYLFYFFFQKKGLIFHVRQIHTKCQSLFSQKKKKKKKKKKKIKLLSAAIKIEQVKGQLLYPMRK